MASVSALIDGRREDGVDSVTLNRPEIRNAINDAVIEKLTRWAESATRDPQLRMAVLGGTGKTFCAGADLRVTPEAQKGMRPLLDTRPPRWVEDDWS